MAERAARILDPVSHNEAAVGLLLGSLAAGVAMDGIFAAATAAATAAFTTGAVAGRIAGASYGLSGIPFERLDGLAWRSSIIEAGRIPCERSSS